eukprot:SAG22_NODE_2038_length_3098_cov_1.624542_2_plen_89_part_00
MADKAAVVLQPTRVEYRGAGRGARSVQLSGLNIAVLTADGALFVAGDNSHGQLGFNGADLGGAAAAIGGGKAGQQQQHELKRYDTVMC